MLRNIIASVLILLKKHKGGVKLSFLDVIYYSACHENRPSGTPVDNFKTI